MWELCLFRGRLPVPPKKVANGDVRFFTERDWNQGCCHGNDILGANFFSFVLYIACLKITAPIFLEIFSIIIQYFIVLVELFMTSSLSSFA